VLTVSDLPSSIRAAASGLPAAEAPQSAGDGSLPAPMEERSVAIPMPPTIPSRVRMGPLPGYPLRQPSPPVQFSPPAGDLLPAHASAGPAFATAPASGAGAATISALRTANSLEARVDVLERRIIQDCLARNNYRRKETAAELGISRVTLYNKMKKYGLL
jgi:Bacterial regulatory protein, Fis family